MKKLISIFVLILVTLTGCGGSSNKITPYSASDVSEVRLYYSVSGIAKTLSETDKNRLILDLRTFKAEKHDHIFAGLFDGYKPSVTLPSDSTKICSISLTTKNGKSDIIAVYNNKKAYEFRNNKTYIISLDDNLLSFISTFSINLIFDNIQVTSSINLYKRTTGSQYANYPLYSNHLARFKEIFAVTNITYTANINPGTSVLFDYIIMVNGKRIFGMYPYGVFYKINDNNGVFSPSYNFSIDQTEAFFDLFTDVSS